MHSGACCLVHCMYVTRLGRAFVWLSGVEANHDPNTHVHACCCLVPARLRRNGPQLRASGARLRASFCAHATKLSSSSRKPNTLYACEGMQGWRHLGYQTRHILIPLSYQTLSYEELKMVIKAEQYGTMIFIILFFLSKIIFSTSVLSLPFSCL